MNPRPVLSSGTTGAIHEYLVTVDLLKKGYHVFRATSPSCECDLAILKDKVLSRVEVTTGNRTTTGKLYYPRHPSHLYDILAIVVNSEGIIYVPEEF
jgi:hypothetical protein